MSTANSSGPAADRNLLFGILALQMDFISRDALIEAMHAWVLHKDRPLGQILRDQNRLTPDLIDLLETLVSRHIAAHAGDARRSLAAIATMTCARRELQEIADAD